MLLSWFFCRNNYHGTTRPWRGRPSIRMIARIRQILRGLRGRRRREIFRISGFFCSYFLSVQKCIFLSELKLIFLMVWNFEVFYVISAFFRRILWEQWIIWVFGFRGRTFCKGPLLKYHWFWSGSSFRAEVDFLQVFDGRWSWKRPGMIGPALELPRTTLHSLNLFQRLTFYHSFWRAKRCTWPSILYILCSTLNFPCQFVPTPNRPLLIPAHATSLSPASTYPSDSGTSPIPEPCVGPS